MAKRDSGRLLAEWRAKQDGARGDVAEKEARLEEARTRLVSAQGGYCRCCGLGRSLTARRRCFSASHSQAQKEESDVAELARLKSALADARVRRGGCHADCCGKI